MGKEAEELASGAAHEGVEDLPERIGAYRVLRQLGEGGMGVVYAVQHDESTQVSALKVIRAPLGPAEDLAKRFRREGELLRRLRHPGIAAFYDAGEADLETQNGPTRVPFLTMELVEGELLLEYARRKELDPRQRTELLARVADALHHAHGEGIVHRDLKPGNVHVVEQEGDPVGQPKLLDFGIARVTDSDVHTASMTLTGMLLGTLPYMSPEQVSGGVKPVEARSDVYSLGVMLFELLSGQMPYPIGELAIPLALRMIQFGEPDRLGDVAPHLKGDLEWIVERALEKEPERRYATAQELALDLRAANAGRPVTARPPGLVRRARRFLARYPLASSLLATSLLGLLGISFLWVQAARARDLAVDLAQAAEASSRLALEREADVRRERGNVLRLADRKRLDDLELEAQGLWPAHPRLVGQLDAWLERADELLSRLPGHQTSLGGLRSEPFAELPESERAWWIETLGRLVDDLSAFGQPGTGTLEDVRARRESASTLARRSTEGHADLWRGAIADVGRLAIYRGLDLVPQMGLVPLDVDPASGLWEFWHVESGQRPLRDERTGALQMGEESGVVLVLVPGGSFSMGAQPHTPGRSDYDALAAVNEQPPREVTLSPFFLSKFELTQGQWLRAMHANPSFHAAGTRVNELLVNRLHPVERVSWNDCSAALYQLGLSLPSEAQWEYAARAGTTSPWWCGATKDCLAETSNLSDQYCRRTNGPQDWVYEPWDDGYHAHAPVDSFAPNPFGLHHTQGNVAEWCLDRYAANAYEVLGTIDPLAPPQGAEFRSIRGGDYSFPSRRARTTFRDLVRPAAFSHRIGVRPARPIDPPEEG